MIPAVVHWLGQDDLAKNWCFGCCKGFCLFERIWCTRRRNEQACWCHKSCATQTQDWHSVASTVTERTCCKVLKAMLFDSKCISLTAIQILPARCQIQSDMNRTFRPCVFTLAGCWPSAGTSLLDCTKRSAKSSFKCADTRQHCRHQQHNSQQHDHQRNLQACTRNANQSQKFLALRYGATEARLQ